MLNIIQPADKKEGYEQYHRNDKINKIIRLFIVKHTRYHIEAKTYKSIIIAKQFVCLTNCFGYIRYKGKIE
jgi:hypothetical protein